VNRNGTPAYRILVQVGIEDMGIPDLSVDICSTYYNSIIDYDPTSDDSSLVAREIAICRVVLGDEKEIVNARQLRGVHQRPNESCVCEDCLKSWTDMDGVSVPRLFGKWILGCSS
jgi:hypothetical protein